MIYKPKKTWQNTELKKKMLSDNKRCFYCNTMFNSNNRSERFTIDHFIPECNGGSEDESNLKACCGRCNSWKSTHCFQKWLNNLISDNKYFRQQIKINNLIIKESKKIDPDTGVKYEV